MSSTGGSEHRQQAPGREPDEDCHRDGGARLGGCNQGRSRPNRYDSARKQAAAALGADPVGLHPGDQMTLRDLLYAALMQSDNIAALTLADHVGRTLPRAADVTAERLRLHRADERPRPQAEDGAHAFLLNPHGLDNMKGRLPYSTAGDTCPAGCRLCDGKLRVPFLCLSKGAGSRHSAHG